MEEGDGGNETAAGVMKSHLLPEHVFPQVECFGAHTNCCNQIQLWLLPRRLEHQMASTRDL